MTTKIKVINDNEYHAVVIDTVQGDTVVTQTTLQPEESQEFYLHAHQYVTVKEKPID